MHSRAFDEGCRVGALGMAACAGVAWWLGRPGILLGAALYQALALAWTLRRWW